MEKDDVKGYRLPSVTASTKDPTIQMKLIAARRRSARRMSRSSFLYAARSSQYTELGVKALLIEPIWRLLRVCHAPTPAITPRRHLGPSVGSGDGMPVPAHRRLPRR